VNLPAGLAVALAILVLLPLAAVAVGRRWRDPPPEKWGIPAQARVAAANTPQLIAYRRRIALGVADPRKSAVVDRAISTGTAAPPELRAATRELAMLRIDELDRRVRTTRVTFGIWVVLAAVVLGTIGYVAVVRHEGWFLLPYGLYWCVRAYLSSLWSVRRLRRRAEAAVVANGS
jgi:hypothetical protein